MSTVKQDTAILLGEIATIELIKDVNTKVDSLIASLTALTAAVANLSVAHADTAAIVAALQPTLDVVVANTSDVPATSATPTT